MYLLNELPRIVLIGIAATAMLDLWIGLLRLAGVPTLNFALIGRWAGHLLRGRLTHAAIAATPPVRGELALGWLLHYAVGIGFALLAAALLGRSWLAAPTPGPALAVGLATVLAPFLLMQPAMGAGFAASRTPRPWTNRLRSLVNHAVFGAGLYLAALGCSLLQR